MSTDSKGTTENTGIGLAGVLGVVFVVLRLCHVIAWSWWWVLAPFWIPAALFAVLMGVITVLVVVKK